jgi:KDO2-lipid IV(A) lauroyltransferase
MGLKISRKFGLIFALMFYYLIPIRKKTVLDNLRKTFPDLSEKEIKRLAFANYKSFAVTFIEIFYSPFLSKEEMKNLVKCDEEILEVVKQKYALGNGLIVLSGHIGNWEWTAASVALQLGLPFSVIIKPQRNPFVTKWLDKMRTKWGNSVVPLGVSVRQTYQVLLQKKVVAMVADQRGPIESPRIIFLGRSSAAYTGPAILALKTGAPIFYGISVRQPDMSYKAYIEEITTENLPDDENEKVLELTKRHNEFLETFIRKYPEQWFWMHKRWKY